MWLLLDGEPVQAVQMAIPFTFRMKRWRPGSWLLFSTPRRALTPTEFAEMFPTLESSLN